MDRIIYHGSQQRIKTPIWGVGKMYNDYGLGFYCTEDITLAKEWAVDDGINGYANRYLIHEDGLNIIYLNGKDFTPLHWIELLLHNRTFDLTSSLSQEAAEYLHRNFHTDISEDDVIVGYRADDSYFTYAQEFLNGTISVKQLSEAMQYGNLGLQYVLKSKKAFSALLDNGYEVALSDEWFAKKQKRDSDARRQYLQMNREGFVRGNLYMVQILDEEVKADDARLR